MKSNTLRLELLMASTLPVAAILLVGMQGMKQMENSDITVFLLILLASAIGVFVGEMALIRLMQRATREQFQEIVQGCREYVAGDRSKRLRLHGDNALTTLAQALNTLFEAHPQEKLPAQAREQPLYPPAKVPQQAAQFEQAGQLDTQLQRLIQDVAPVMEGDLRVRASIPAGNVGVIADICNALVEEIVELVQWTRYSAEQVINGTGTLLDNSIELAEAVETQMLRFSQTTEAVENLVAFLQRLSSSLHLSYENMQEVQQQVQRQLTLIPDSFLQQLETDIQRQVQLLESVLNSTQSNASLAEVMISDFYAFAKRIHESSTGILQTAEHINALASLAEQWQQAVVAFQLPTMPQSQSNTSSLRAIARQE